MDPRIEAASTQYGGLLAVPGYEGRAYIAYDVVTGKHLVIGARGKPLVVSKGGCVQIGGRGRSVSFNKLMRLTPGAVNFRGNAAEIDAVAEAFDATVQHRDDFTAMDWLTEAMRNMPLPVASASPRSTQATADGDDVSSVDDSDDVSTHKRPFDDTEDNDVDINPDNMDMLASLELDSLDGAFFEPSPTEIVHVAKMRRFPSFEYRNEQPDTPHVMPNEYRLGSIPGQIFFPPLPGMSEA